MNREFLINEAILAHQNWVRRFWEYLASPDEELNSELIRSDKACILGKWLHTPDTNTLLSPESVKALLAIHATFHEVAYLCATMTQQQAINRDEYRGLVQGLENLSNQLVEMLQFCKRLGKKEEAPSLSFKSDVPRWHLPTAPKSVGRAC